jgi:hypothetical protein
LILNWTELGSELGEAGDMDEKEDGGLRIGWAVWVSLDDFLFHYF